MNDRESLMRKIQMYCFTAHECALYLDGHPNNRQALSKYRKAIEQKNEAVKRYEGLYGPITVENAGGGNVGWNWVVGQWPWQNKED